MAASAFHSLPELLSITVGGGGICWITGLVFPFGSLTHIWRPKDPWWLWHFLPRKMAGNISFHNMYVGIRTFSDITMKSSIIALNLHSDWTINSHIHMTMQFRTSVLEFCTLILIAFFLSAFLGHLHINLAKCKCIDSVIGHNSSHLLCPLAMPQFSSVHSVVSDFLWPHGLQHAKLPCPSWNPGACSNSWPLSQWCHPTISSSLGPSHPAFNLSQHQSFLTSQFFASDGQSIGVSASVLPMNIQDWFPLGWTGWISLQSRGLSRVFSNTTVQKYQFFHVQISL